MRPESEMGAMGVYTHSYNEKQNLHGICTGDARGFLKLVLIRGTLLLYERQQWHTGRKAKRLGLFDRSYKYIGAHLTYEPETRNRKMPGFMGISRIRPYS